MEHTIKIDPAEVSDDLGVGCFGIVSVQPKPDRDGGIVLRLSQDNADPNKDEVYWLVEIAIGGERIPFITNGDNHYMTKPDSSDQTGPSVNLNGHEYWVNVNPSQGHIPRYAIILAKEAIKRFADGIYGSAQDVLGGPDSLEDDRYPSNEIPF